MNEQDHRQHPGEVRCRRTGRYQAPEEHERCPYCFGTPAEIETARHEDFCEFRPDRDPISFGLPHDALRHRSG